MPTSDDLAMDTIDNGFGNDSESQIVTSSKLTNNNTVIRNMIIFIFGMRYCRWIHLTVNCLYEFVC